MDQKWSTQYVPPPVSHLLQYPIKDEIDDIEQGLCKPDNENLFLISSIAFLQKQLIRKMEKEHEFNKEKTMDRKYSDLLIVEAGHKSNREKYYIRLQNIEKFDEVLRSEACLPSKTLSNTQLLPLPKKTKSPKLTISNIFKHKPSLSLIQNPTSKRSYGLFNVFRKVNGSALTTNKISNSDVSITNSDDHFSQIDYALNEHGNKFINSAFSINSLSIIASDSSTLASQSKAFLNHFVYKDEYNSDALSKCYSAHSNISNKSKTLSEVEEEILRIIPSGSVELKKSITENLRVPKNNTADVQLSQTTIDFIMKEDDYYEDVETGIKFKCVPKATSSKNSKVKEQQSKLSVCIEEEMESDLEIYHHERRYPFNCTDDVKAMVSSEAIDLIMRELLQHLEKHIK